jgi:hypothetical protein
MDQLGAVGDWELGGRTPPPPPPKRGVTPHVGPAPKPFLVSKRANSRMAHPQGPIRPPWPGPRASRVGLPGTDRGGGGLSVDRLPPFTHVLGCLLLYYILCRGQTTDGSPQLPEGRSRAAHDRPSGAVCLLAEAPPPAKGPRSDLGGPNCHQLRCGGCPSQCASARSLSTGPLSRLARGRTARRGRKMGFWAPSDLPGLPWAVRLQGGWAALHRCEQL